MTDYYRFQSSFCFVKLVAYDQIMKPRKDQYAGLNNVKAHYINGLY